jgi:hypothetical protein
MMNADRAAAYLDISKTKFLEGVSAGVWPVPRDVGGLPRWDRLDVDAAVDAIAERKKRLAPGRKSFDELMAAPAGGAESQNGDGQASIC